MDNTLSSAHRTHATKRTISINRSFSICVCLSLSLPVPVPGQLLRIYRERERESRLSIKDNKHLLYMQLTRLVKNRLSKIRAPWNNILFAEPPTTRSHILLTDFHPSLAAAAALAARQRLLRYNWVSILTLFGESGGDAFYVRSAVYNIRDMFSVSASAINGILLTSAVISCADGVGAFARAKLPASVVTTLSRLSVH